MKPQYIGHIGDVIVVVSYKTWAVVQLEGETQTLAYLGPYPFPNAQVCLERPDGSSLVKTVTDIDLGLQRRPWPRTLEQEVGRAVGFLFVHNTDEIPVGTQVYLDIEDRSSELGPDPKLNTEI